MSSTKANAAIRPVALEDNKGQLERADAVNGNEAVEARDTHAESKAPPAEPAVQAPAKKKRRSPVLPIIALAVLAGAGWYGYNWWTEYRFMVSTDDAYIQGDIATITPKISGYVMQVNVQDNERVKKGDVLVTLDDGDYQIALDQAKASLNSANLTVSRIDAQIEGGEATLAQAKAEKEANQASLDLAQQNFDRTKTLQAKNIATTADLDTARSTLAQAKATLTAADASIASAQSAILVLKAQRAEAEASVRTAELSLKQAERDLSFTTLKAPYDGVVGNKSVQVGDYVSASSQLMALVPTQDLYVAANFKETQLQGVVPGSKVKLEVDAYSDMPIEGTVESISPGSGSVFSLLPPENATGNFTKIIQRVPVRIALPKDALDTGRLRAGLSVVVDVDTRTAPNK